MEAAYNYLDLLNPQQRAAVVYKDGPALVIAGAGSGKTRVLTYKIVDLIRSGYEPYRILALTFTNKAANEMKERVRQITGDRVASQLWMGTFHSIFLRILRRHAELIGFKPGFTIYDTADSRALVKSIVKDLGLDEKIYKPNTIASRISNAKNALISAEMYQRDPDNMSADKRAKIPMMGRIFQMYADRCRISGAMDFDDILYYMNVLLRDNPDLLRHYQDFFRYILVDEYQDTNFAQNLIVSQLAGERQDLCVVGDDAQSIYSFRGANISNILDMQKRFPGLRVFKLERNYRSTQNIINAAGSLIEKNTRQLRKNVYSENEPGEPVHVLSTYSDIEEAYLVANMISRSKLTVHDSYDEYAVLYRTNSQSRVLEESLRKRNIPYRIYGGLTFYQRKEVKDAVSYFRMAVNPDDDEALRRIINYPARGIGETTMKKLAAVANEMGVSMWQVISLPATQPGANPAGFNSGTLRKLDGFRIMVQEFLDDVAAGSSAYEVAQLIYNRSGILATLAHDTTPESLSRQQNLQELLSGVKDFVETHEEAGDDDTGMAAFLSEVQLATDLDQQTDADEPKVTLMTVHSAKGLEFKHVYVVGVEEELFPAAMSMDSMAQVEEERRLLYVAITRAKQTCVLTYASSRFRNGQTVMTRPSRFLSDIDRHYLKVQASSDIAGPSTSFTNPVASYRQWGASQSGNTAGYRSGARGEDFNRDGGFSRGRGKSRSSFDNTASSTKIRMKGASPGDAEQLQELEIEGRGRLRVGSVIKHDRFGLGQVRKIERITDHCTITVDFGVVGLKKLIVAFAKFTIIS